MSSGAAPWRTAAVRFGLVAVVIAAVAGVAAGSERDPIGQALEQALDGVDQGQLRTGLLYDRVLPLSGIERFDGSPGATAASPGTWLQICDELSRSAVSAAAFPGAAVMRARARSVRETGAIPIGVLDIEYEHFRTDAMARGALVTRGGRLTLGIGDPFQSARVVAASVIARDAIRGTAARFVLDRGLFLHRDPAPRRVEADFDDGLGDRVIHPDEPVLVEYPAPGPRTIRLRLTRADGSVAHATTSIVVIAAAPLPDDTLQVTSTVPYLGSLASGRAYVALAPGHIAIANPIVVVEGFDLDNTMDWNVLYEQLNQQNLLEDLKAGGFDVVVLDFTDATDYIQRNAYVVSALIEQLEATIHPQATLAVVGASMGGLCSRYALDYLETGAGHRVRTWLSFDAPHAGANIPLGVQYWVQYFAGQSAEAAFLLQQLMRPAARQMLVYQFTDPPGPAAPDPLRTTLTAEFAALGDYPALPRRVAVANGSGSGQNQGFAPGAQIVRYEFSNLLVDIIGNVWALPNLTSGNIFQGRIRILFSDNTRTVPVTGTLPYDGAPGGSRATMAQMDATAAPYGDIVALHPAHAFIPTVSALAVATTDPFYDVAGDPNLLDHTPFHAVFYPDTNEGHVTLSPAAAGWIAAEMRQGVVAVPSLAGQEGGLALDLPVPNPFADESRLAFTLPRPGRARLDIVGVDGRRLVRLLDRTLPAGVQEAAWDGRDAQGTRVRPGIYFIRLETGDGVRSRRVVRIE